LQDYFFASILTNLTSCPLVVSGWSASENYLVEYIENAVKPLLDARPLRTDELSVIDITFNPDGHARLATCYKKTEAEAHVSVDTTTFTVNQMFLWLQAFHGVSSLRKWASAGHHDGLDQMIEAIKSPPDIESYAYGWFDVFLPVWVRLCWRCNLVPCVVQQKKYDPRDLPLESGREEYIPLGIQQTERPDLRAAASLLDALEVSGNPSDWDPRKFPGALYRDTDQTLLIPLPAWNLAKVNDLRGLKIIAETIRRPGAGYIDKVSVLFLTAAPADVVSDSDKAIWKAMLAGQIHITRFAQPANIAEIQLHEL